MGPLTMQTSSSMLCPETLSHTLLARCFFSQTLVMVLSALLQTGFHLADCVPVSRTGPGAQQVLKTLNEITQTFLCCSLTTPSPTSGICLFF